MGSEEDKSVEEAKTEPEGLDKVARRFQSNLRMLRVFNERIGAMATEHDRMAVDALIAALRSVVPESLAQRLPGVANSAQVQQEVGPTEVEIPTIDAVPSTDAAVKEEFSEALTLAITNDPAKRRVVFQALSTFVKAAPLQGSLLATSVLVSLMIYFEALITDLLHAFYERFPEALPAEERTLSLAALKQVGSIEEAEELLVQSEIDSVLRDPLDSQLKYLAKRPGVDVLPLSDFRPLVVEIDQRRNLYVHNRGIVNRTYIQRVDPALVVKYAATLGKEVGVSGRYLRESIDTVEVVGIVLLQQCWRKWRRDNLDEADGVLLQATYNGLQDERYELVCYLARYATGCSFQSDVNKRMVCINRAIALRDSGRASEIESVLNQHDWSACGPKFQLALYAVRGQEDGFYRVLPRAAAAREVKRSDMEEWPLFRNFRGTERFGLAVRDLFPETKGPDKSLPSGEPVH